ncbi:hypothetical protein LTR64_001514 [Lithohypha guttulata]|uniref:uncharacterized protein n=1 Tax=Lithohypha guttulata TaxID=1690604 RepID=UPI002DDFCA4C|nr:hypothetical protein LTR51_003708 [Lithohypha guttulata]
MKTTGFSLLACLSLAAAQTAQFEAREATIASVHAALFTRQNTCRDVVSAFIARVEAHNPDINAVIRLNPECLNDADELDQALTAGNATGSLFCVPILLKDNYDTAGIPTTAGCKALNDSVPMADAPSVAALRGAGAIILGKANLHEFALEGLSLSSLGGQTVNPYDFTRTPGGSSGGTGAAVAASFAVFGTGTDTVNSLRSPASANSLYSFRPTYGLISRTGVVPVSWVQDTLGVIGRSLYDIAVALTVMSSIGYDSRDNTTARVPDSTRDIDYTTALTGPSTLRHTRIGVLRGFFNYTPSVENDPVNVLMASTIQKIIRAGAEVVYLNDTKTYNATAIAAELDVQQLEYRELVSAYLSSSNLTGNHPRSLPDLYLSNRNISNFVVIPSQYNYVQNALRSSTSNATYTARLRGIANLTTTLHSAFSSLDLDAIIYPEQKNLVVPLGFPSQSGRNGILAALTGSPVMTIPIGFSNATESAPIGIPVGMEILGMPWTELKLLSIARALDDRLHARRAPVTNGVNETAEVTTRYASVPTITPRGLSNINQLAYPLGTFGA